MLIAPYPGAAYETDQFSNRLEPIEDATVLLNEQVNKSIEKAVSDWKGRRSDRRVVNRIYHDIGGHHWVDKLERWVMKSPKVDRLRTPRHDSIYAGHPLWATRFAALFGVGPTIKINGTLVGSDKIGHFLSQGRKYYRRYLRYEDEARAGEWSAFTERAIFGQMTTGSYSNADLVANYEGFRFYLSLFEDNVIDGKPSILKWEDGRWEIQRPFDWADHVNAYWDEALNINHYDRLLYPHMRDRLLTFCDDYHDRPGMYVIEGERRLLERYSHLELRTTDELRLYNLCDSAAAQGRSVVSVSSEP